MVRVRTRHAGYAGRPPCHAARSGLARRASMINPIRRNSMKNSMRVLAGVLLFAALGPAWADSAPPPMGVWTGKGQFGYLSSSGNTDAQAVNANLDMSYTQDAWKH